METPQHGFNIGLIAIGVTLVGKIIWDWLTQRNKYPCYYHNQLTEDIADIKRDIKILIEKVGKIEGVLNI